MTNVFRTPDNNFWHIGENAEVVHRHCPGGNHTSRDTFSSSMNISQFLDLIEFVKEEYEKLIASNAEACDIAEAEEESDINAIAMAEAEGMTGVTGVTAAPAKAKKEPNLKKNINKLVKNLTKKKGK